MTKQLFASLLLVAVALSVSPLSARAQVDVLDRAAKRTAKMNSAATIDQRLDGCKSIELETKFALVNIRQAADSLDCPYVKGELESMNKDVVGYQLNLQKEGSTAKIGVVIPEGTSSFACSITIFVTPDTKVMVNSSSGNVTMEKLKVAEVAIVSHSGKIHAKKTEGIVNVTTKAGAMEFEQVKGSVKLVGGTANISLSECEGNFSAETDEGFLNIANCKGSLRTATLSGKQSVDHFEGDLDVNAKSGQIRLQYIKGGTLKGSTTKGSVEMLNSVTGQLDFSTVTGTITSGQGVTLTGDSKFESQSGRIKVRLLNKKEELSFNITCDDKKASINAKGQSKKKKLESGNGPIKVTSHSQSGDQVFP